MQFFLITLAIVCLMTSIRQNLLHQNFKALPIVFMSVDSLAQTKFEKQAQNFIVEYSAPTVSITIKNLELNWTVRIENYQNPVSAIPNQVTIETKNKKLTNHQLYQLKNLIQSSGFINLKPEYGAPTNQRYYPYSISVQNGKKQKKVVYRSNPAFGSSPQAFQRVESYLQQLIK